MSSIIVDFPLPLPPSTTHFSRSRTLQHSRSKTCEQTRLGLSRQPRSRTRPDPGQAAPCLSRTAQSPHENRLSSPPPPPPPPPPPRPRAEASAAAAARSTQGAASRSRRRRWRPSPATRRRGSRCALQGGARARVWERGGAVDSWHPSCRRAGDTGRGLRAGDGRPARSRLREACRLPHLRALSLALAEQQRVRRRRDEVVRVVRDQRERTGAAAAVGIEGTQQHLVRRTAEVRRDGEPRSAEIRRDEGRDRGSTSRKSSRDWLSRPSKAYGRDVAEMWPRCSRDTAEIQPRCSPDTTEIQPKHHLRGRRRPRRGRAAAAGISRIISARSRLDLVEGLVEDEQSRRREQAVDNHRLSRLARRHGEERPVAQLVEPKLPEELARLGGTPLRTPLRGGVLRHTMPAPRAKSKGCAEYTRVRVFSRAACARAVRLLRVCCPTSRLARLASRDGRLECGKAGVVCVRVVRDRERRESRLLGSVPRKPTSRAGTRRQVRRRWRP